MCIEIGFAINSPTFLNQLGRNDACKNDDWRDGLEKERVVVIPTISKNAIGRHHLDKVQAKYTHAPHEATVGLGCCLTSQLSVIALD